MSKRTLPLMIGLTLGLAGTAAIAQEPDELGMQTPPPAAAASMNGQTVVPNTMTRRDEDRYDVADVDEAADPGLADNDFDDDDMDLHASQRSVHTQSPPNDPLLAERIHDDDADALAEAPRYDDDLDDTGMAAARASTPARQDPNDYAAQPIASDEFDQTRATMPNEGGAYHDRPPVEQGEGTPFAQTAGTGGFSDGVDRATVQRFQRLDSDDDGDLSRDEVAADSTLAERFADYDINGDGTIARNEFQSYFAAQNWLEGNPSERVAGTEAEDNALDSDVDADLDVSTDASGDTDVDLDVDHD